jgi:hypothetical protein
MLLLKRIFVNMSSKMTTKKQLTMPQGKATRIFLVNSSSAVAGNDTCANHLNF